MTGPIALDCLSHQKRDSTTLFVIPNLIWDDKRGELNADTWALSQSIKILDQHRDTTAIGLFHDLHGAL